jgi:nucleotide-binding universal stress UspA family protein
MLQMRTLLVPTDFSAGAQLALDHAVALSRRLKTGIRLLHCYRVPTELELLYLGQPVDRWEPGIREGAARQLAEVAARISGEGIPVTQELACGNAAPAIARAASSQADLIVMGSLGRSGIAESLLGSVAERTVREAPCPVLVVRPQDRPVSLPGTAILPIDFSVGSDRALAFAHDLLLRLHATRVVLVHAHDLEDLPSVPVSERDSLAWALKKFVPEELEELATSLRDAGLRCEVRIEQGPPARVITDCARQEEADWILMSSHGRAGPSRWLMGSVAERLLRTAPCSVLVLRCAQSGPEGRDLLTVPNTAT